MKEVSSYLQETVKSQVASRDNVNWTTYRSGRRIGRRPDDDGSSLLIALVFKCQQEGSSFFDHYT